MTVLISMADKQLLMKFNSQIKDLQGHIEQSKGKEDRLESKSSNHQFSTYSSQVAESIDSSNSYLYLGSSDIIDVIPSEIIASIIKNDALESRMNQNSIASLFSSRGGIYSGNGPTINIRGEFTYLGS